MKACVTRTMSNSSRVRQQILALAHEGQPKPMFESWESIPLHFRLLMLEHITLLIAEVMREPQSTLKSFLVRIDYATTINRVTVSARHHEEAFEEAKQVLHLENKDVEGTVVPA